MADSSSQISVIVPASNEAGYLGECLRALLKADWPHPSPLDVIVVENGSTDDTAAIARAFAHDFDARNWRYRVIEHPEGNKAAALNAGDRAALAPARVYLDADVTVSPRLLTQIAEALAVPDARFVSGTLIITAPDDPVSRAYARVWARVPFMAGGVPGCGLFAVNAEGRARWDAFPDLISDDTFVRLHFTPAERQAVSAPYDWPVVRGLRNLIRVRARQNRGVAEIRAHHPELFRSDDHRPFPLGRKLALAWRDPLGFAVYVGVAVAARLAGDTGWSRGR